MCCQQHSPPQPQAASTLVCEGNGETFFFILDKEKSLNKTITNRVISKFKKELNIENESDINDLYMNIKLDV